MRERTVVYAIIMTTTSTLATATVSLFLANMYGPAPLHVDQLVILFLGVAVAGMFGYPDAMAAASATAWGLIIGFVFYLLYLFSSNSSWIEKLHNIQTNYNDWSAIWTWPLWMYVVLIFTPVMLCAFAGYASGFAFSKARSLSDIARRRKKLRRRR